MALKVAIVGLASDSRVGIPWDDPQWEVWGLPWDAQYGVRFHRTFDPHDMADLTREFGPRLESHLERLRGCAGLYMQENYPEVPNARRYPREAVAESIFDDGWSSSISYAMSLAIHEGAQEIALYGVAMEASSEYVYQRPHLMYLIGLARGRGIKVSAPAVLCGYENPPGWSYRGRYGCTG